MMSPFLTCAALQGNRPLFFIAHSIGGLVVKNALVRASQKTKFQDIMDDCHGVTFFGTPHRGSSYMSMPNLRHSIQDLLQLEAPLPDSLSSEIRVNNPTLLDLHGQFVDIASELRLWSFYETQECLLSGTGEGFSNEVQFTAPLVSVKSAILELWQEDPLGVDCDHARLASFGNNEEILASYLGDLAGAIQKAEELSSDHHPLRLKAHVPVEVIGFYDDTITAQQYVDQDHDSQSGSIIRLYATKYPFKDFLRQGPEKCLSERLQDRSKRSKRRVRSRSRSPHRHAIKADLRAAAVEGEGEAQGLGIDTPHASHAAHGKGTLISPEIVVTSGSERPRLLGVPTQTASDLRPPSQESNATISTTISDPAVTLGKEYAGDGPLTEDMLAKQQSEIDYMLKEHAAGFSRPNPALRKFTWIHMPFNNPVWVKDIFSVLSRTQGYDFSRLFDYDNWQSKHIQNRHSDTQPAFVKATCKYLSTGDRVSSPRPTPLYGPVSNIPNCLYLYIPYLHFDTYRGMIERRKLIKKRRERGRAKPVPREVAEKESLELKAIWEYIGFDPPLNCRRTLDQFGHHSLRDTNSRDDDQMLYKLTKKDSLLPSKASKKNLNPSPDGNVSSVFSNKGTGTAVSVGSDSEDAGSNSDSDDVELKEGYVLMVDQLWLWSIDQTTLATFFPRRHSTPNEGTLFHQADLRNSVYNELNGDLTGRTENSLDLAALIVWHAVIVFLERSSHPDLDIFRLFDEAIGMLVSFRIIYIMRKKKKRKQFVLLIL